jgi:FMN phosphatase YigB (HAD superfamily)
MLTECVTPARKAFNEEAERWLKPYAGVHDTLAKIKKDFPQLPIIALTDAPRYVAMWKLNKLKLLHDFDAVYGLPDPRLPTSPEHGRVKVDPEILLKHLRQHNFEFKGRIRILPEDYEKPGTKGLKTVLMDFELDENALVRKHVVWVGDNLKKDVSLGHRLGVTVGWAKYGTDFDQNLLKILHTFSSQASIHKNVHLKEVSDKTTPPDFTIDSFDKLHSIVAVGFRSKTE